MSNRDCDVTRSGVRVVGDSDGRRVFVGAAWFVVDRRPLFVSAEDVHGVFVAYAGDDDIAYLLHPHGDIEVLGVTAGVRNVLVTDRGVYWTDRGAPCVNYWHRDWAGNRIRQPIPIGGTSQGISYQKPDGTLVWADQEKRYVDGAWKFYLHPNNRVLAEKAGEVFDCGISGSFEPRGREMSDGSAVVAVNRLGVFVESKDFTPYLEPPLKPIPVPSVTRLIWRGMDGWDGETVHRMPGNFAWSDQPGAKRPIFEGPPWSTDVKTPMLAVLIGTESDHDGYASKDAQVDAAIADALEKNCPLAVYSDAPNFKNQAEGYVTRGKDAGCDVVRVLQFYPPTTKSKVKSEIDRLKAKGSLGLMVPLYTGNGAWSEKDLERVLTEAESLLGFCVLEAGFGGNRQDRSQRAVDYLTGAIDAMPEGEPPPLVTHAPQPDPDDEPIPPHVDVFFPDLRSLF